MDLDWLHMHTDSRPVSHPLQAALWISKGRRSSRSRAHGFDRNGGHLNRNLPLSFPSR